jgi:hypothetical protein
MALSYITVEDVLKTVKDKNVQMIDLRFTDLPGVWQHFSVPPSAADADALNEGIGFDGSSIRGFQEIQESDLLVVADPTTAFLDPFATRAPLPSPCKYRLPSRQYCATGGPGIGRACPRRPPAFRSPNVLRAYRAAGSRVSRKAMSWSPGSNHSDEPYPKSARLPSMWLRLLSWNGCATRPRRALAAHIPICID